MLSGRNALQSINLTLQQLHQQIDESDGQIQQVSDSLLGLQQQQAKRYQELARIRLDHIISSETAAELEMAERRVMELLQLRKDALLQLSTQLDERRNEQKEKEQQREIQGDQVAEAAKALDDQEALTRRHLQQGPAYSAQLEKSETADRIAAHAEEKMQDAQNSREQKGKPYEADPLFSYLWDRSYGTKEYSASAVIRFFDKWVAGLCSYHAARPDYARLLEIPIRLQKHAAHQRRLAEKELQALRELEESAAGKDGIPALREAHEQAQNLLDEIDGDIRRLEDVLLELAQQKASYSSGDDARFRLAVDTLAASLKQEDVDTLYAYARLTTTAEDDLLVRELPGAEQRGKQLQQTLLEYQRNHEKYLSRLAGLEQVRRNFKRERFDDIQSGFGNGATLTMILNQFLQGLADSADLWSTIRREQQHRPRGRGFPAGNRRTGRSTGTWRFPFPGGGRGTGSGGSWGGGGSRGGGGGGFRTGGGF
jgi:hypothetical protein